MADELLFANIETALQQEQTMQSPWHCPGVRCKKKKNSEIKHKSNSVHWASRAQLLCSKSLRNISFILHWVAHNSVLLLESHHGRNSQTQLAPSWFLKRGCKRRETCRGGRELISLSEYQRLTFPPVSVPALLSKAVSVFLAHAYRNTRVAVHRLVPCRYLRPNTSPTHTQNSTCLLPLLQPQKLLDAVNYTVYCGWLDDVYVIILFCIQKSNPNRVWRSSPKGPI